MGRSQSRQGRHYPKTHGGNSRLARTALEAASPYVRPFRLPKYTSETLNWIENFWSHLKDTYFSQMFVEEREAFYPDTVRLLRRLHRSGQLAPLTLRAPPEKLSCTGLGVSSASPEVSQVT